MSYKKLNLDQNLVEQYIRTSKDEDLCISDEQKGPGRHLTFCFNNDLCLLITFLNKKGESTLQFSAGNNPALSKDVADEIVDKCKISDNSSASCTFKNIDDDYSDLLKDFIATEIDGAKFTVAEKSNNSTRLIADGKHNDKATITFYHTTKTALLQGKPLPIFQEIKLFFYEIAETDDIIEIENKIYDVEIKKTDVTTSLKGHMPTASVFLDDKVLKILTPAIALDSIRIPLDDYTCMVSPALRGLEGYIRQVLKTKCQNAYRTTTKIGSLFKHKNADGFYKLQDFVKTEVNCEPTGKAIEESYNFYHAKRHPYSHVDKTVSTTPIIERQEDAQALNVEIFAVIEKTYNQIP